MFAGGVMTVCAVKQYFSAHDLEKLSQAKLCYFW